MPMTDFPPPPNGYRPLMQPLAKAQAEAQKLGFATHIVFDDTEPNSFWTGRPPDCFWQPHPGWVNVIVRGGHVTQVCYGCS
jgi:hypothetical protein